MLRLTSKWLMFLVLWATASSVLASAGQSTEQSAAPMPFQQDAAILIHPDTQTLEIGPGVQYTKSAVKAPSELKDIAPSKWQVNTSPSVSLGFQPDAYWFLIHLQTRGDTPREWLLEQGNPLIDHMSLFLYREGRFVQQWHTGDALPFSSRPLNSARFQFPLELEPSARYQLYLRVDSTEALDLPLMLNERFYHDSFSDQRALVEGAFLGFLVIMAAYSLSIFVIVRDRSYLNYVFYVVAMLLFFLSQQGLLYQYFFPDSPTLQFYFVPWSSLLIFLSIVGFFQSFLHLNQHFPKCWRLYLGQVWIQFLGCLSLFVLPYHMVVMILAVNGAASMLLAVSMIIQLSLRGSRPAQIVLFGWGLLFAFIWLFTLARTGVFYNQFFANYVLRLGVSLEILVFSFALSYRINQERTEKEWALNNINMERTERIRAQELALQSEIEAREAREQSLQLEIDHREGLQRLVDERTADLEKTLLELEQANFELEQLSARDALTGLYNRRSFDTRLQELWSELSRRQKPLSMLLLDVDHFKQINDTLGHPCGDMVLRELARLLGTVLHRPTDMIARYGGEEFAVLLPETPVEGALHVAGMIVHVASEKVYQWEGKNLTATVSVGVNCLIPTGDNTSAYLIEGADRALYQAKRSGRNRFVQFDADAEWEQKSG